MQTPTSLGICREQRVNVFKGWQYSSNQNCTANNNKIKTKEELNQILSGYAENAMLLSSFKGNRDGCVSEVVVSMLPGIMNTL